MAPSKVTDGQNVTERKDDVNAVGVNIQKGRVVVPEDGAEEDMLR